MTEKTDYSAASKDYFGGDARGEFVNRREAVSVFPDMPKFCESFFIFAASLKLEQVSGKNENICVESIHNFKGKIFGSINAIPQSIKSKTALWRKKTMKSTIKLVLVVVLFSSVAFADGEMGNGGKTCPNGATSCLVGSGTSGDDGTKPTESTDSTDSILGTFQEYLDSMFKYFEN